jgi:RNA polymerase sigma-70 factor (ECF subfamily)
MFSQIEACVPALRRYAVALLGSQQDADDLVHDCLVRALDRLHTRRNDDGDLRAWLLAILHNLFISQRRRAAARPDTKPLHGAEGIPVGVPGTQEGALRWRELVRALYSLPEDQRAVILLVALEDLSYAETARVLGIPVGTVMSRLSRGRERLREMTHETGRLTEAGPHLRRIK